jgi:hypothetical protein
MTTSSPPVTLAQTLPELAGDIIGALVRQGRGDVADQVPHLTLRSWTFDDFAQSTYLDVAETPRDENPVRDVISLYDEIGVNLELDARGRLVGLEVVGYEDILSRIGGK